MLKNKLNRVALCMPIGWLIAFGVMAGEPVDQSGSGTVVQESGSSLLKKELSGMACPVQVAPEYPRDAQRRRITGTVTAQATFWRGKVIEVTFLSYSSIFDESIASALFQYQCDDSDGLVVASQEFDFLAPGQPSSRMPLDSKYGFRKFIANPKNGAAEKYQLGWVAEKASDFAKAVRYYQESAEGGSVDAQAQLGYFYWQGIGVRRNDVEAVRLLKLASDRGHAMAQNNLGAMYQHGLGGLPKDDVQALGLYQRAAEAGNAVAQTNIAYLHEHGRAGLTKNETEAVRLYRQAGRRNALALTHLARMHVVGSGGLTKDEGEAVLLYQLAAAQGEPLAQATLGYMYLSGNAGLVKDEAEAVRLFRMSANRKNSRGLHALATMHEEGRGGLSKSDEEAVKLYRLAADQGFAPSQFSLGGMYEQGRGGLSKDMAAAARLYQLAKDSGHKGAGEALIRLQQ